MAIDSSRGEVDRVWPGRWAHEAKLPRHKDTELHLAGRRGDLDAVRQIIAEIDDQMNGTGEELDTKVAEIRAAVVNEANEVGETALLIAAERGFIDIVVELLHHSDKEGLARKTRSGFSALHVAAREGHRDIVKVLLDHDPYLGETFSMSNTTPLITAAIRGHLEVVNLLLKRVPGLVQLSNANGKNALHLAARMGYVEIVKALLGSDHQLARRTDKKGQTALHMAVKGTSVGAVKALVNADPTIVMLPDNKGYLPLGIATRKKRSEIVNELLLLPEMSMYELARHNKRELHLAVQCRDLDAVRKIIAKINAQTTSTGEQLDTKVEETALHIAAGKGFTDIVLELLKHSDKDSLARMNESGYNALHVAAEKGHRDIVKVLLDHDPSLGFTITRSTITPLVTAAIRGHLEVLNLLLEWNSELAKIADVDGKTALHYAARLGHVEIVKALLQSNHQLAWRTDRKGQTAFHKAVKGISIGVVKALVNVDPVIVTLPDRNGNLALHTAIRNIRSEIVKELLLLPDINVNALTRDHNTAFDIAEGLPLSKESAAMRDCLSRAGAVRADDLNQPRDELRRTVTEIKKDVQTQPEQARKANKNVYRVTNELRKLHMEGIDKTTLAFSDTRSRGYSQLQRDQAIAAQGELEHMLLDESAKPKPLPLQLLDHITSGFSDDKKIGSGGFAIVYKGMLECGLVAVKKLLETASIDDKKFTEEVRCLMMAKHKNIVRFLGYCSDTQGEMLSFEGKLVLAGVQQRLLCFEYLPKGSLEKQITDASCGLKWRKRYNIINGICDGLYYLHQLQIVHLDLKPENILLDDHMMPKISDFGLSRCFDDKQTRVIASQVFGTMGYMAPEFLCGRQITFKSDIYSLGIILIRILTGEKGYPCPDIDNVLESWRNRLGKSEVDAQLLQIRVCTQIAIDCTDWSPEKRPDIHDIIARLGATKSLDASATEIGTSG